MKASKFINPRTGLLQWNVGGVWVTDPAEIARIEAACAEDCLDQTPMCVESQEWTYGIDNTGTDYRWTEAVYEIDLSDGTTLTFEQSTAANGGWTPQMQEWGENIQQAVNEAGLLWFVETRYRVGANPANLAGGGGFPGPPSLAVSNALQGMEWRYVNIQICPGQPVPTSARVVSHSGTNASAGLNLTTAGPVMGPLQKFWLCKECGEAPVWYLQDGVTLAEEGQIPKCWEPCGTLTLAEAPPERDCEFFFITACDNQNDPDPLSWIVDVTRRTTVCNGAVLSVDYFQADPGDPTSLLDYELLGAFVDCASGEPIEDEVLPCTDPIYMGTLWQVDDTAQLATTVDWWAPATFPAGQTSAPHDNVSDIFTVSADGSTLEHVNGAPSVTFLNVSGDIRTSNDDFLDSVGASSSAQASGNDQLRVRGYIILNEPAQIKDTNPNTGERGGIWINKCCAGDLELLFEDTTDSAGSDTSIFDGVRLPVGRHYFEAVTSDVSAWQGFQLSVSFDDGANYAPLDVYDLKPKYNCIPVARCVDTGQLQNAATGEEITVGPDDLWCEPPACLVDEVAEGSSGSVAGPTAAEIAAAMVDEERSRTSGRMESWQNNGSIQSLNVPPGTMGCLRSITDYGSGAVYWTIDGTAPSSSNGSTMSVQYGNNIDLCGIDLSLVRLDGSSSGSDYSVTYEVWS